MAQDYNPVWGEWVVMAPKDYPGDLSDGMLAYFQWATKFSDSTVEGRLEKEPFDFRNEMLKGKDALTPPK